MNWYELYKADKSRNINGGFIVFFLFHLRKARGTKNPISRFLSKLILVLYKNIYGLEISYKTQIGKGFYIGHPYGITINPKVVIGQENRGKRKGVPIIGNQVWIGVNSAIVGNVRIGDNVLIAPCTYINCDIPNNSIVFGNPCIIKHNDKATDGYINRIV